jgi:hypothetical protein
MTEGLRGAATGAKASTPGWRPGVPKDVQTSFLLWLAAVAAGVFETFLAMIRALSEDSGRDPGLLVGVGIRLANFAAVVYVAARMRLGKNWARFVLAFLLGGGGTLSIIIGPISWLAAGYSVGDLLAGAGLTSILFASSRVVHLASVFAALVFMFRPAANRYYRAAAR